MKFNIIQFKSLVLTLILGSMIACDNKENVVTTTSGLEVEMHRSTEGARLRVGDVIEANLIYGTENGVEMFNTDKRGGPVKIRMTEKDQGLFNEMFQVLKVGDSASCQIPVENLYEVTFGRPIPDSIERGTKLQINIAVLSAKNLTERLKFQLEKDLLIIDAHLDKNRIMARQHESGLRYVINKEGIGGKPSIGDSVTVHYTGKFLNNGRIFDSSRRTNTPFKFVVGRGVIEGWSTGFSLLNVGTEATFYIPSTMAYGENGHPAGIPPNAILIFDVEFIEMKKN